MLQLTPELTPYQFASNTPIEAVDLDGLEAMFVHGTFSNRSTWDKGFVKNITKATHWDEVQKSVYYWNWLGANNSDDRVKAGTKIYDWFISENNPHRDLKHATLIGHSHGGNVNKIAKNLLEKDGWRVDIINIETPQRIDFQSDNSGTGIYMNFYSSSDLIQWFGTLPFNISDNGRLDQKAYLNFQLIESNTPFSFLGNLKTWFSVAGGHSLHNNPFAQQQVIEKTKIFFRKEESNSNNQNIQKRTVNVGGKIYKE